MLPNFICPGAQKSATTTLHDVLVQHPEVFLPDCKETHFFDRDDRYERGLDWYDSRFYGDVGGASVVGDITPRYMYYRFVPERLAEDLGSDLRLLFMLRNPVDRAYSQYWMHRSNANESMSFQGAVDVELRRRRQLKPSRIAELERRGEIRGYVGRGFYARQIERFLEYFPRDQMKIVLFSEFVSDIPKAIEEILAFLGLGLHDSIQYDLESNSAQRARFRRIERWLRNRTVRRAAERLLPLDAVRRFVRRTLESWNRTPLEKPPLSPSTRRRLIDVYADDITQFEQITGRKLADWRRVET